LGEELHGMPFSGSDVVVGVGDDFVTLQERGQSSTGEILLPAEPDWFDLVHRDHGHLGGVVGAAVIARKVKLVGWAGDQKYINAFVFHTALRASDTVEILCPLEQLDHKFLL
jgi:hypothetical protein